MDVLSIPSCGGYWWLYDSHCYGWEPVHVFTSNGELRFFRTGSKEYDVVSSRLSKWAKLEYPEGVYYG